jgi:DNA primase
MSLGNEIRQILKTYGISFKENNKSVIIDCPHCLHSQKLYIRKTDGKFICFYCSSIDKYTGTVNELLSELLNLPLEQIEDSINTSPHIQDIIEEPPKFEPKPLPSYVVNQWSEFFDPARKYLLSRGITHDLSSFYRIMFDPVSKRIIFPIYDKDQFVGWTDRIILPEKDLIRKNQFGEEYRIPKSYNNFAKSEHLLFEDLWDWSKLDHLILTEGPFDAMKLHLAGGAIASCGKMVSETQKELILSKEIKKLYLALDPDAYVETEHLVSDFYDYGLEIYQIVPPPGRTDMGDCSLDEAYQAFLKAKMVSPASIIGY